MSHDSLGSKGKGNICPHCKALNGKDFDTCVRCGRALSAGAQVVQGLGSRFSGEDLLGCKILMLMTVCVVAGQILDMLRNTDGGIFSALMSPTPANAVRFGGLHSSLVFGEPWRLLSAVFPHFGIWHIFANMSFLTWLGRTAEPAIGSARFVLTYLLTGITGFVLSVLYSIFFEGFQEGVTAGASGAVFGITGLVLGLLLRRKNPVWKRFVVQGVLFQLLVGFLINWAGGPIMINNLAHLGGLLPGLVIGLVLGVSKNSTPKATGGELFLNVAAILGLLFALATLIFAQLSPVTR